jgi:propanediol dehydratase small subunit
MLQIIAIVFFAAVIFVLADMNTRRIMSRFIERGCAGLRWRRRFPDASKTEIRDFLDIFIESFGFKQRWRLCFRPEDRVMDVYRTLYPPGRSLADGMELESLVQDLQKRYRVDILGSWREDITLADLFTQTRRPVA